jgi:transcriptional regulator with XRE-family HTH domain
MKDKKFSQMLGARLKVLRESAKLSQEALAVAAGISSLTVSKIELGIVDPKASTLFRISGALKLTFEEMFAELSTVSGVRPWEWTRSSRSFDRGLGVLVLELLRA